MGLQHLLIYTGNQTGIVIGRSFLLGEKSFYTIPFYNGYFPAIGSFRQAMEFACVALPSLLAFFIFITSRFGFGVKALVVAIITSLFMTLIEGTTLLVFAILALGNAVMALFIYYLVLNYLRDNLSSYLTAIFTYIFITDGVHYLVGATDVFFILNGVFCFVLTLIPVFVALYLSFFSPLKQKFEEPIPDFFWNVHWKTNT
jgi:hypothetical protein